jgi:hypothetical protein
MTSEPGIRFDYRPSRVPLWLASIGSALVLLALFAAAIPLVFRLPVAAAALALAFHRQRHRKDRDVRRVQWASDGVWTIYLADGREVVMALNTFRTFGAQIVLNLRAGDVAGPTLWLAGDNTDGVTRRRLRMRLARVVL